MARFDAGPSLLLFGVSFWAGRLPLRGSTSRRVVCFFSPLSSSPRRSTYPISRSSRQYSTFGPFFVKSANCIRGFPRGCKNDIGIGDRLFNYLSKPLMKGGYLDDPALRLKRWLRRFTNRVLYVANGAHCSPHRSVSRFQSRLQLTNSVSGDFDGTRIVIWRGASTAYKLLALSR